jgi:uncharacterized protein (TIGR02453 family)
VQSERRKTTTKYFDRKTFEFLDELEENNNKPWWEANKDRYLSAIKEPALEFIAAFGARMGEISSQFVADTRVNGGSLMRPYRDMRFAKGAPYKTNVGIQFRHRLAQDVHAPGFYVHLQPRQNFLSAGMWHPETSQAKTIREAIHAQPRRWGEVAHSPIVEERWNLAGHDDDRLKRVPRELDTEHPYREDLRLRSFSAGRRLTQRQVTSATFLDEVVKSFKEVGPFTRFLCEAIGVPF